MLNFIDGFLILLWSLIKSSASAAFTFLIRSLNLFFRIIDFFFKRDGRYRIRISESDFEKVRYWFSIFSLKMESSTLFRRWVFSVLIISAALYLYPPSHWGPWYSYQKGIASFYGKGFLYRRSADNSIFRPYKYTAAHKTLPFGTTVKVVNTENGKSVFLTITDRGPFAGKRIIDISPKGAEAIGLKKRGTAEVIIYTRRYFNR
jgi:rare lipoprotein A